MGNTPAAIEKDKGRIYKPFSVTETTQRDRSKDLTE